MIASISKTAGNNASMAGNCRNCLEELNSSLFRLESSLDALHSKVKDARAWLTAVVMHHSGCYSNFVNLNNTIEIQNLIPLLEYMSKMSGNLLIMVRAFDLFGSDVENWAAPKTERDGFFEPNQSMEWELATKFPTDLKIDATVSKDGNAYETVQEAVDAAPSNLTDKKFVINIKAGIYEEIVRVPLDKRNLVFLGDGIGKTVITGNLSVGPVGISTYNTATVGKFVCFIFIWTKIILNLANRKQIQIIAFSS